jgi:hypothetical protein
MAGMRLEYFDLEHSKGVLLAYEATSSEIESLLTAFTRLRSENPPYAIEVTDLPGCEGVDGCSLTLCRSSEDVGVEPAPGRSKRFRCSLSPAGWAHAAGMLEPFQCELPKTPSPYLADAETRGWASKGQHQYLTEVGAVELILSTHREW